MADLDLATRFDRRRALTLGGGVAGGLILTGRAASAGIVRPAIPPRDGTLAPILAAAATSGGTVWPPGNSRYSTA